MRVVRHCFALEYSQLITVKKLIKPYMFTTMS